MMQNDYFEDTQNIPIKSNHKYNLNQKSASMTPRSQNNNQFNTQQQENGIYKNKTSSFGILQKRNSLLSMYSRENNQISDSYELKSCNSKQKKHTQLSNLSVMNQTHEATSNRIKRLDTPNQILNNNYTQNERNDHTALNTSQIRRQINQKGFQKISSFNQQDGEISSTNSLKKDLQTKQEINMIFNQLYDVYDKEQINHTIQKVKDPKEREKVIDRIIKRRNEIQDAEQIVQISQCSQLINRFMNKIKKNKDDNASLNFNFGQMSSKNMPSNISENKDRSSRNQYENLTFSSLNQKWQQTQNLQLDKENTGEDTNKQQQNIQISQLNGVLSPKSMNGLTVMNQNDAKRKSILTKGFALSIFMKQKSGLKENQNHLLEGKNVLTPNQSSVINTGEQTQKFQNSLLSGVERKDMRNLSFVTKDHLLMKNQLPSNIEPGTIEAKLYLIDMNSISDRSKLLLEQGQNRTRQKASELLKDYQKLNLASHFKSKSLSSSNFNYSSINTFNYKREINKKKTESKIQTLSKTQKEYTNTFKKLLSYDEPQDVLNIVQNDVASYLSKVDNNSTDKQVLDEQDIFMPGQIFRYNEIKKIDRGAKIKFIEQAKSQDQINQSRTLRNKSAFKTISSTSHFERSNFKENSQFLSTENFDSQPYINFDYDHYPLTSRENTNKVLPSFQQLQTTSQNIQTQASLGQESKQYIFNQSKNSLNKQDTNSQSQLDLNKNNQKPSSQIKQKTIIAKNSFDNFTPDNNILQPKTKFDNFYNKQSNLNRQFENNEKSESQLHSSNSISTMHLGSIKAFHLNKISLNSSKALSCRNSTNNKRNNQKQIKYSKAGDQNLDLYHDTNELNHSTSFASYTEVKLDQLYSQSNRLKTQMNQNEKKKKSKEFIKQSRNKENKLEIKRNSTIKNLSLTGRYYQNIFYYKQRD